MYLGLPGDGKSMSGVRRVVTELLEGERDIITNLPLEVGELESYIRAQPGGESVNVRDRIFDLEEAEVRKFWLKRGHGWWLRDIEEADYKKNIRPNLKTVYRYRHGPAGVERKAICEVGAGELEELVRSGEVETGPVPGAVYVIDESQNFWPARSWQQTPSGLMFYLSQHRHVGDDCIFITQTESQVEKTVRNLVAEYWVFRDMSKRRKWGFRLPGRFTWSLFGEPPSALGANMQAFGSFSLDKSGLASCYRTADGVGVGGPMAKADMGRKKAGVHWAWFVVLMVAVAVGVVLVPDLVARVASKALVGGAAKVASGISGVPAAAVASGTLQVTQAVVSVVPAAVPFVRHPDDKQAVHNAKQIDAGTNRVRLVGCLRGPRKSFLIKTSDGRFYEGSEISNVVQDDAGNVARVCVRGSKEWIEW